MTMIMGFFKCVDCGIFHEAQYFLKEGEEFVFDEEYRCTACHTNKLFREGWLSDDQ